MFTGIVEGQGIIAAINAEGDAMRLSIDLPAAMASDGQLGESVAINGCCLTVIQLEGHRWSFQAGTETLSRTNLGRLAVGHRVNLERALPANARLGGHFVQGHVDGLGHVERIDRDGEWIAMWFRVPTSLAMQMISKGSVAIDGVSLTLVDVEADRFSIALIPHTLEVTTLGQRSVGDPVNIETDVLGKYVQKMLAAMNAAPERNS